VGPFKVISKLGINFYKLLLPKGCRLHRVIHCGLLSHGLSATSLRPHQTTIEGDHDVFEVDFISDDKIDNWPRRKGPYFQFLTRFMSFNIPRWILLEKID